MGKNDKNGLKAKKKRQERKEARKRVKNGRSSETKETLERVLIVTEGTKTEPLYFNKLIEHLRLVTTDIKVTGESASCPQKVVEYAIELYEDSINTKDEYDLLFCVIDKDSHAHYKDAILSARKYRPKDILYTINSIPCFELWLLLHYTYTTKPFQKIEKKSICETLIKDELKKYLPRYEKNISNLSDDELEYIFNDNTIQVAIKRAEQLLTHCESCATDNPSTKVHQLVVKLQEIKKRPLKDS